MSSAVGLAVIDALEEDGCQKNSLEVGNEFLRKLAELRDKYETVGDVRGKGLMIGVEMVNNKESKTPLVADRMANIWEACKNMGVLIGKGGLYGNVFRVKPPMCITKDDVNFAVAVLDKALYEDQCMNDSKK
jgi:alanine-glyoxylate transaminase/(R)-3-amino-2-methylpropionate-pyruvate transaminase